jgi:hypothetical protein
MAIVHCNQKKNTNFHQQKTRFLLMKMKSDLSGWLSVLPCCMQREADEITTLLIAVFAVKSRQAKKAVKS